MDLAPRVREEMALDLVSSRQLSVLRSISQVRRHVAPRAKVEMAVTREHAVVSSRVLAALFPTAQYVFVVRAAPFEAFHYPTPAKRNVFAAGREEGRRDNAHMHVFAPCRLHSLSARRRHQFTFVLPLAAVFRDAAGTRSWDGGSDGDVTHLQYGVVSFVVVSAPRGCALHTVPSPPHVKDACFALCPVLAILVCLAVDTCIRIRAIVPRPCPRLSVLGHPRTPCGFDDAYPSTLAYGVFQYRSVDPFEPAPASPALLRGPSAPASPALAHAPMLPLSPYGSRPIPYN
ncbi:hypothetical protein B0H17DRAFT_1196931 [Mycena rosella]|uniref:Uncharacterized protein n=1 Tax=Mycena rosella TaxID=1033263 RepID=A0AAD7GJT5_MYCRO|nr:hypothetical protein B0H17DRAFT_1196931 [Mycena rosella]